MINKICIQIKACDPVAFWKSIVIRVVLADYSKTG